MKDQINEIIKFINDKFGEEKRSYESHELPKYFKIVMTVWEQKSVYAFIAKSDFENKKLGAVNKGDIFKADGWTTPAKHSRGKLFDQTTWTCLEQYGPCYLR